VRFDLEADARYVLMRVSGLFAPPDAVEVIPGLHVGSAPKRRAARSIARAGVSYAIDLRANPASRTPWPPSVQTFSCPLEEYEAPSLEALTGISRQVAALIEAGEIVYVHCRAGIQRAPLVACAVLVEMGWTLPDAVRLVSSRRAVAALSDAQVAVLRKLDASRGSTAGLRGS
jgi:Dual specificity phosphatase, catalytic domain